MNIRTPVHRLIPATSQHVQISAARAHPRETERPVRRWTDGPWHGTLQGTERRLGARWPWPAILTQRDWCFRA